MVHGFETWDWHDLTFKAVAERAGVGERTVYRHFPTEQHLHDAVMEQLEHDAGITYEDVDLDNLSEVTARIFGSLQRFSVRSSTDIPDDPTFTTSDQRRRDAVHRAVVQANPQWSERQQQAAAGLLDVLWNIPTYERLVGSWGLSNADAIAAVTWLLDHVVSAMVSDQPPLPNP